MIRPDNNVTSSNILRVFMYYLEHQIDDELLLNLFEFCNSKKNKPGKDIALLKKIIKQDEFFKSVANHINTFYNNDRDETYFSSFITLNEGLLKRLAKIYIRLAKQYAEENNKVTNEIKKQLGSNFENAEISKSPDYKDNHDLQHSSANNDITIVYRWDNLDLFQGRDMEIQEIHKKIRRNQNVIINGNRGIGKTSLVQAYLALYSEEFDNIVWITVMGDIKQSMAETLSLSGITDQPIPLNFEDDKVEKYFDHLLLKMGQYKGENILILDNVCSIGQIQEVLNKFRKMCNWNWKTIITTNTNISRPKPIELSELNPDDAYELFKSYYLEETDQTEQEKIITVFKKEESQIRDMIKRLNYHPLLIELIAKVDIEDDELTLEKMCTLIKSVKSLKSARFNIPIQPSIKNAHSLTLNPEEMTPFNYIKTIFEKDLHRLTELQKRILLYFSILPTVPIPMEDIVDTFGIKKENLLSNLHNLKGWVKFDQNNRAYKMMELHQFAIREILKPTVRDFDVLLNNINSKLSTKGSSNKKKTKANNNFLSYKKIIELQLIEIAESFLSDKNLE